MKNEIILSSILLLNPVANLTAQEIGSMRTEVAQTKQFLADMIFESPTVKHGEFWKWNATLNRSERFTKDYKVRVKFIISRDVEVSNYSFNGDAGNGEMDYQAIIEKVDAQTGEVLEVQDNAYFAKRLTKNKFRIFDCNSSYSCWEEPNYSAYADMYVFNTPEGRILKTTKNSTHTFDEYVFEDKVLYETSNHYR